MGAEGIKNVDETNGGWCHAIIMVVNSEPRAWGLSLGSHHHGGRAGAGVDMLPFSF